MERIPPLQELRRICQKPRYREVGNWYVRRVLRDAAVPATWIALRLGLSADAVTLLATLVGTAGAAALAVGTPEALLGGALLLHLWYYLDHVDGQVARARGTASLTGLHLDFLMHHWIHALVPFGLGWGLHVARGSVAWIAVGFAGSVGMVMLNLHWDALYKAFWSRLSGGGGFEKVVVPAGNGAGRGGRPGPLRSLAGLLHKGCEIHAVLILLLAAVSIERFLPGARWTDRGLGPVPLLALFWGGASHLVWTARLLRGVFRREPDRRFEREVRPGGP